AELGGIHLLAMEAFQRGDLDSANPLQEKALRLARAGEDQWFLSVALDNLGLATRALGDTPRALTFLRRALAAADQLGHRGDELSALAGIAACEAEIG